MVLRDVSRNLTKQISLVRFLLTSLKSARLGMLVANAKISMKPHWKLELLIAAKKVVWDPQELGEGVQAARLVDQPGEV